MHAAAKKCKRDLTNVPKMLRAVENRTPSDAAPYTGVEEVS